MNMCNGPHSDLCARTHTIHYCRPASRRLRKHTLCDNCSLLHKIWDGQVSQKRRLSANRTRLQAVSCSCGREMYQAMHVVVLLCRVAMFTVHVEAAIHLTLRLSFSTDLLHMLSLIHVHDSHVVQTVVKQYHV
jgi:hypothetical protein